MGYLDEYGEEQEVAELYRLFARLFMKAPTTDDLLAMKEIFQMTFDDTWQEVKEDFSRLFGRPLPDAPGSQADRGSVQRSSTQRTRSL